MTAIQTRIATPADAVDFVRLNAAFNEVTLTREQAEANLSTGADRVILAIAEGNAVGFAGVLIVPRACYAEPYAEVTELYVDPIYRRQGAAQALMRHAEQLAREGGAPEITVCTGWDNMAGQQLYHGLGYVNDDLKLVKRLQ